MSEYSEALRRAEEALETAQDHLRAAAQFAKDEPAVGRRTELRIGGWITPLEAAMLFCRRNAGQFENMERNANPEGWTREYPSDATLVHMRDRARTAELREAAATELRDRDIEQGQR